MENIHPSRLKIKFHLKSKALLKIDDLNKENLHFKKTILNNIKLKSKIKFSLTKKIQAQTEESSKQKDQSNQNLIIPSIPTIKKQIMRNNTGIKKIPSASYTSSSSFNKVKMTNTINYSIQEENQKIENRPKIFKERNSRINCLKNLKKQFFSGNLILPKHFWFRSGKNINDKKSSIHKNTFSDLQSFGSFFNYNSNNNSNTTANTHNNSNKKSNNNSFQKSNYLYKIDLKTLSRKNSIKQNYTKKNICPIRYISNKNKNKSIKEENKNSTNNNNSYINKNCENVNMSINSTISCINNYNEKDNDKRYNNIKYSGEYINDILNNLLQEEKELKLSIDQNYFSIQPEINDKMRAILIDWLIDVHSKFNFREETLYITIYIIDCYLSIKKIERCNFQLLGVTALFISCKQNEIIFRRLKEYAYITDNAYTESDITNMENLILKELNFNLLFPSSLSFYEILCNNLGIINDDEKFYLGEFLMQSFFIDSNSLKYSYSTIACASTYIVMKFFKMKNYQYCYNNKLFNIRENKTILMQETQNNSSPSSIIKECAKDMCYFVGELSKNNLKATIRKFSCDKYRNVSRLIFGTLLNKEDE